MSQSPYQPYKILQTMLEKVKEKSDEASYSKDQKFVLQAILDNQARIAESILVLGAIMQVIVDNQIQVKIDVPSLEKRN